MIRHLVAWCFGVLLAWGYESVMVLTPTAFEVTQKAGYWIGNSQLDDVYVRYKSGGFSALAQKAQSLGYGDETLWVALEGINHTQLPLVLSLINSSLEEVTLYTFEGASLVDTQKSGALVPRHLRRVESLESVFMLRMEDRPMTYLIRINSTTPLFFALAIGDQAQVLRLKMQEYLLHMLFVGVFGALFFYNLFLYFSTNERDYLHYTLYTSALFVLMSASGEYFTLLLQSHLAWQNVIKIVSFQLSTLLLLLFTLHFLGVEKNYPRLYRIAWSVGGVGFLVLVLMGLGVVGTEVGLVAAALVVALNLMLGMVCYRRGSVVAQYYLVALGGFFVGVLIVLGLIFGLVSYTLWSYSAMMLGAAWEMVILAFALGHKIRELQAQRNDAVTKASTQEKVLFLQSRYAGVGELIGNIAHQWRQPLGEIGAIHTNLKASLRFNGDVKPEKLLDAIEQSYSILHHLSETIDTFYRFFRYKKTHNEFFEVGVQIANIQRMVHYSFETEHIQFIAHGDPAVQIYGDKNEFAHALLNMVLNAKEVLVERHISDPWVKVEFFRSHEAVIITVEDNAQGITLAPIERIFVSYVTSKKDGTGIGLYITKMLIEQSMHGRIGVTNGPNGAIFMMELPLSKGQKLSQFTLPEPIEEVQAKRISALESALKERMEIEQSLKKWADAFAQTRWGIAVYLESENHFEMANPAFMEMYGYSQIKTEYVSLSMIMSFPSQAEFTQAQERLNTQGYVDFESIHRRKNGTLFPVHIEMMAVKNEQGMLLYHITNVWDITEQKAAQKALMITNKAFNNTNEAIYITLQDHIISVNEGACRMLGYTRQELESMTLLDIDCDASIAEMRALQEKVIVQGSNHLERRHLTKDGRIIDVEILANNFIYEGENYAISTVRDITVQKAAHQELLLKEFALNTIHEGVFFIAENSSFHYVNEGASMALGYTHEELLSKHLFDIDPDLTAPLWKKYWAQLKAKRFLYIQSHHRRKDGTVFPIEIGANYFEYNGVGYSLSVVRDMTERLQLEAEKENRAFRRIAENIPDNIARWDRDGRYLYVNSVHERTLGQSADEIIGSVISSSFASVKTAIAQVCKTGERLSVHQQVSTKEGQMQIHEVSFVPERDEKGEIVSVLGVGRDITTLYQLQDALAERAAELEKALEFNKGIINAIPDLFFEITPDGTYVGVWAQNEELLIAQREKLLNKNFKEILPPEAAEIAWRTMREVDAQGHSLGNVYSLELHDSTHWFELSMTYKKSTDTYITLSRDITARKRAEHQIIELNATLEEKVKERTQQLLDTLEFNNSIINALPDLLFEVDANGTYLGVWAQNEELLAAQREKLLGHTFDQVLSPQAAHIAMEAIREAQKEGLSFGKTIAIALADGEHWFELSVSKKRGDTYVFISRDVTRRVVSEARLREREERVLLGSQV